MDASGAQPHAVLTGDTLFIGDVGRADLRGVDQQIERALHKIEARLVGVSLVSITDNKLTVLLSK